MAMKCGMVKHGQMFARLVEGIPLALGRGFTGVYYLLLGGMLVTPVVKPACHCRVKMGLISGSEDCLERCGHLVILHWRRIPWRRPGGLSRRHRRSDAVS